VVTLRAPGRLAAVLLGWLVAACDGTSTAGSTVVVGPVTTVRASGFDAGPVRTAAEYLAEAEFAAADLARGELLGLACAACHKFGANEGTLIGPNLHGVFGRRAAAVPGFDYSPALEQSGLVWTPVSLAAWLGDPAGFVAGTTMAFSGYRSADDRRDLIAYLLRATQ
jgi:cytochrome c